MRRSPRRWPAAARTWPASSPSAAPKSASVPTKAWRESRPMRRDAAKRMSSRDRATRRAGRDQTWRKTIRPALRDLWKRRTRRAWAPPARRSRPAASWSTRPPCASASARSARSATGAPSSSGCCWAPIAGAIAALLLAPKRGEEMRRELGERADEVAQEVASRADEIATKAKDAEWVPIFQRERCRRTASPPRRSTTSRCRRQRQEAAADAGSATGGGRRAGRGRDRRGDQRGRTTRSIASRARSEPDPLSTMTAGPSGRPFASSGTDQPSCRAACAPSGSGPRCPAARRWPTRRPMARCGAVTAGASAAARFGRGLRSIGCAASERRLGSLGRPRPGRAAARLRSGLAARRGASAALVGPAGAASERPWAPRGRGVGLGAESTLRGFGARLWARRRPPRRRRSHQAELGERGRIGLLEGVLPILRRPAVELAEVVELLPADLLARRSATGSVVALLVAPATPAATAPATAAAATGVSGGVSRLGNGGRRSVVARSPAGSAAGEAALPARLLDAAAPAAWASARRCHP